MSISYLSKPNVPSVTPYQEPIQYILQAAQIKQNKYDKVLDIISNKENALLSIDTRWASKEITNKKDNMLKKMEDDLNTTVKLDLLNPDNIKKVDNLFKPITNDKEIQYAASFTKMQNKSFATYDQWRENKPELYDPKNESHTLEKASRNIEMSSKDFMMSAQVAAPIEYIDLNKAMRESVKDLPANTKVFQTADGKGWIFKQEETFRSMEDIMKILPNGSKILAQAEVNGAQTYSTTPQNLLLDSQRSAIESERKSFADVNEVIDKERGYITSRIKDINNDTPDSKKYLESQYGSSDALAKKKALEDLNGQLTKYTASYNDNKVMMEEVDRNLNEFDDIYKPIKDSNGKIIEYQTQLNANQLDNLKTQVWWRNEKRRFAEGWAYNQTSREITADPFALKDKELSNTLKEADVKLANDLEKMMWEKELGLGSSGSGSGGSSSSGGGASGSTPESPVQVAVASEKQDENKYTKDSYLNEINGLRNEIGSKVNLETGQEEIDMSSGQAFKDALSQFNTGVYEKGSSGLSSSAFKQKVDEYQKIQMEFDADPKKDLNKKISGSELTYGEYLYNSQNKNPGASEIRTFLQDYSTKKSAYQARVSIFNDFKKDAMEVAESGLDGVKIGKFVFAVPETKVYGLPYPSERKVTIPEKYAKAFLSKTLSHPYKALQEIATLNGVSEKTIREKYYNGDYKPLDIPPMDLGFNPTNQALNDYKETIDKYMNNHIGSLSLSPVGSELYPRNLNVSNSPGSTLDSDMKVLIAGQGDIDKTKIKSVKLVPTKDNSGYKIKYSYESNNALIGVQDREIPVSKDWLDQHNIYSPIVYDIENILNVQFSYNREAKRGSANQIAQYRFDWMGKTYWFQQIDIGTYRVAKKNSDGTLDFSIFPTLPGYKAGSNIPSIEYAYRKIIGDNLQNNEDNYSREELAKRIQQLKYIR